VIRPLARIPSLARRPARAYDWLRPIANPAERLLAKPSWLLAGLLASSLAARLPDLSERVLKMDELSTVGFAALGPADLAQAITVDRNMALYYWLMFAWLRLVGTNANEGLIRLPAMLAGVASVGLIYLLGRRLFSSLAGLAAAVLVAFNSWDIAMSQQARGYTLWIALTILSYLLLDCSLRGGRWRSWLGLGLVNGLAFYCHFFAVFIIVAQGVAVLGLRSRQALVRFIVAGLVSLTLIAPLVPLVMRDTGSGLVARLAPPDLADLLDLGVLASGGSLLTLGLHAALAAIGLLMLRASGRPVLWLVWSWLVVPVALVMLISQRYTIFNDRYLFAVAPALALVAGSALAQVRSPWTALSALLTLTLSISLMCTRVKVARGEEWRQAVSYATNQAEPGDGWLFLSKRSQNAFEYYAGWGWGRNPDAPYADILEPLSWHGLRRPSQVRSLSSLDVLDDFAAIHSRIWVVLSHQFSVLAPGDGDTSTPVRDWLVRHGYAARQRQYQDVRVILYKRINQEQGAV
jgi:mannosyltransferase